MAKKSEFGRRFPAREFSAAKTLAYNVKKLRQAKGLTQDELASDAQIEQQSLSLIENARANPTISTVEGIATALGVSIPELFSGPPPKGKRTKEQ